MTVVPRRTAEMLLLLITCLWGGTFVLVKEAMTTTSPALFVVLRFTLAFAIACILWPRALRGWDRTLVRRGIVLGLLFGSGFLLQTVGLTSTSASASAFITGTMVVFVPFVYRIVEGSAVRGHQWLSVVIVLIGLWVFTAPETSGVNVGDILTLISAMIWSVYLTYIDVWSRAVRSEPQKQNTLVILQFFVTIVLALVALPFSGPTALQFTPSMQLMWAVLYCGILASVVTTWIQTRFQQYTHPVRAGLIYAVEPLAAAVIAYMVLHEEWTVREAIGASVLFVGIVVPDLWIARRTSS
ncbi:DMT family transporter [soil metagenome]